MIPAGFSWSIERCAEAHGLFWLRISGRLGCEPITSACAFSPREPATLRSASLTLAQWAWIRTRDFAEAEAARDAFERDFASSFDRRPR